MGPHSLKRKGPHGSAFFEAKSNRIRVHSDVLPFALFLFGVHSRLVLITTKVHSEVVPPIYVRFSMRIMDQFLDILVVRAECLNKDLEGSRKSIQTVKCVQK